MSEARRENHFGNKLPEQILCRLSIPRWHIEVPDEECFDFHSCCSCLAETLILHTCDTQVFIDKRRDDRWKSWTGSRHGGDFGDTPRSLKQIRVPKLLSDLISGNLQDVSFERVQLNQILVNVLLWSQNSQNNSGWLASARGQPRHARHGIIYISIETSSAQHTKRDTCLIIFVFPLDTLTPNNLQHRLLPGRGRHRNQSLTLMNWTCHCLSIWNCYSMFGQCSQYQILFSTKSNMI
jgi:hypothetical protein